MPPYWRTTLHRQRFPGGNTDFKALFLQLKENLPVPAEKSPPNSWHRADVDLHPGSAPPLKTQQLKPINWAY
ncbi:hypothetical protein EYF80_041720 [Liparis tanakae]|uniref:Uncharacterized protein n=1 Tax=Liparis tanakae TaxID=230148 RepID=A0A4Z2G4T2_9TELE|nr:hypothetical protein EYF80_041720 [Liparis tanakae]